MRVWCQNLVDARWFEPFIITVIILNAIVLGLETIPELVLRYGDWMLLINRLVLLIFIVEAAIKIIAVAPQYKRYFGDGWNLFDFSVVVLSLLPATGEFAMIARMARLLRVLRLISTLPELRLIVATLVRSLPGLGHVILLLIIIFYMYGIAGYHLLHEHDPVHWRSLGISLLTLFRVLTLEDWTDVMYAAMEMNSFMWIYFVSFVVTATFVVINLFIAVVINNLEEAKQDRLREERLSESELLKELHAAQANLAKLERTLNRK
ncbi:MAG: ion transporter [Gammaproteobacteria bacterium]|nr:ion transporter [Gammaproteobacteria bacterium]